MDMAVRKETPHLGGQFGLIGLLSMLCVTGCVTFSEPNYSYGFLPQWLQFRIDQPAVSVRQAAPVSAPAATFIARFNDEPELETICKNFRRDEAAARDAFTAWAASYDQLNGLQLVRASYSGELILGLPKNDPAGRSPRDVIAAVETIKNLDYIEIDSIARASEGE